MPTLQVRSGLRLCRVSLALACSYTAAKSSPAFLLSRRLLFTSFGISTPIKPFIFSSLFIVSSPLSVTFLVEVRGCAVHEAYPFVASQRNPSPRLEKTVRGTDRDPRKPPSPRFAAGIRSTAEEDPPVDEADNEQPIVADPCRHPRCLPTCRPLIADALPWRTLRRHRGLDSTLRACGPP